MVFLTRLHIGHIRITHTHLISKLFPLSCDHRNLDSPLTVECPALATLRLTHHVPHSLKASLSNDSTSIINLFYYLQAANLIFRI